MPRQKKLARLGVRNHLFATNETDLDFIAIKLDCNKSRYVSHARVVATGHEIKFLIARFPDLTNPTAIGADEIERWRWQSNVSCRGFVEETKPRLWARAYIGVLPSTPATAGLAARLRQPTC